jgi:hypothetical protein
MRAASQAPQNGRPTQHEGERQGSRAGAITASARPGPGSARHVAEAFARLWVNWDWRSAAEQQHALARLATGTLARDLRADADSSRINANLTRDKPGVHGTVATIDLKTSGASAAGIVITREQTYTEGHADLGGRRYRVYRVRLRRDQDRWTVTTWAPQP